MAVLLKIEVLELSRRTVKSRWHRTACRNQQPCSLFILSRLYRLAGVCRNQISLCGHTAFRIRAAVRLRHVNATGVIIHPDRFAAASIQSMEEDSIRRPDSRAVVDDIFDNDRSTSRGPAGDHAFVAEATTRIGAALMFPEQLTTGQIESIQAAIITGHEQPIFRHHRSKTNGAFSEETPSQNSGFQIQSVNHSSHSVAEVNDPASNHRLNCTVESLSI